MSVHWSATYAGMSWACIYGCFSLGDAISSVDRPRNSAITHLITASMRQSSSPCSWCWINSPQTIRNHAKPGLLRKWGLRHSYHTLLSVLPRRHGLLDFFNLARTLALSVPHPVSVQMAAYSYTPLSHDETRVRGRAKLWHGFLLFYCVVSTLIIIGLAVVPQMLATKTDLPPRLRTSLIG